MTATGQVPGGQAGSRVAWFNCFAGVAGDMLLGSLIDAGADAAEIAGALRGLGVEGWNFDVRRVQRAGIRATKVDVAVCGGDHSERRYGDVVSLVAESSLSDAVKTRTLRCLREIGEAEAALHDTALDDVILHELSAIDTLVDIAGTMAALDQLRIDEVFVSPVAVGCGTIPMAHGQLPNPAPAVTVILEGAPVFGRPVTAELATPTGAAILRTIASGFGEMPAMIVERSGFGAGSRDTDGLANVVQVVIGEAGVAGSRAIGWDWPGRGQHAMMLETNVDDATGEVMAYAVSRLLEAGAQDAWLGSVVGKKGRPAFVLHVLCDPADAERLSSVIRVETGTLGLRGFSVEKWPSRRDEESVDVEGIAVRVKATGYRVKVEQADAAGVAGATGMSLRDVISRAERQAADRDHQSGKDSR